LVSQKTIGRLSLYRRLLTNTADEARYIFSHKLASLAGFTAAQVRRDLMEIGYTGSTTRGYDRAELAGAIGKFLDDPHGTQVALVGIGNIGRAILAYFAGRRPKLAIVAAFDIDPAKTGRVIHGCRCYLLSELPQVAAELDITVGITAVPASAAQDVADALVAAGVTGILNFAPHRLRVPPDVYVEDVDMTTSLEKAAYFSRKHRAKRPRSR
jgi:redox-sensing transcriptional repressor